MVRGATSLKKETITIFLVENSIGSEQEIIDYTILPGKMKKSSYICFFLNQEITQTARTISRVLRHIS